MGQLDVSVIMPSYNSEATIEKSISSVISQKTHYSYELIVVDDGSDDSTLSIVKKLTKNNPNIVLLKQEHKFQAEARNLGIRNARGKFIMFCDDDDEYEPDYIEKMASSISTQDASLVIAGIKKVFRKDKSVVEDKSCLEGVKDRGQLISLYLTKNNEMDVGLWNKIFVKKIIEENDIYMRNKNFFEDSLFVLQYLLQIQANDIEYIDEPLYLLKKRAGSTTTSYDSNLSSECTQYIEAVKRMLDHSKINYHEFFKSFEARIWLFYINRNIMTNKNWDSKVQKQFLNGKISLNSYKYLTLKYKAGLFLAVTFPNFYMKLYSGK